MMGGEMAPEASVISHQKAWLKVTNVINFSFCKSLDLRSQTGQFYEEL
jgi:hypothetical protein